HHAPDDRLPGAAPFGPIDFDLGYGAGVPQEAKTQHSSGDVDRIEAGVLEQEAKQDLAVLVRRDGCPPELRHVLGESHNPLSIDVRQIETGPRSCLLEFVLQLFELHEAVIPPRLKGPRDHAVLGIARVVLSFGTPRLVTGPLESELPLLFERSVLLFDEPYDVR